MFIPRPKRGGFHYAQPTLIVISTAGRDVPKIRLTAIYQQKRVEISHCAANSILRQVNERFVRDANAEGSLCDHTLDGMRRRV
jgi:hypothetical protein